MAASITLDVYTKNKEKKCHVNAVGEKNLPEGWWGIMREAD
jgi:hypothetical protein